MHTERLQSDLPTESITKPRGIINLLEECKNFVSSDTLVFMTVHATERGIGLKVLDLAQDLPLALDLKLTLSDRSENVTQPILCVKSQHLVFEFYELSLVK